MGALGGFLYLRGGPDAVAFKGGVTFEKTSFSRLRLNPHYLGFPNSLFPFSRPRGGPVLF